MRDWKIAVMVIMCVVFVVGVTVLSLLIWRVSRTRTTHSRAADALSRRHAGKHDHNHNLDSTSSSSSSSCIVNDEQLVAVAQATPPATEAAGTSAAAATAHVLYFVDGGGVVRAVDLDALSHIRSGAALQHHMAALCGLERADTLALVCYEDGNYNSTTTTAAAAAGASPCREVWVDLDALVARDAAFARRMWQTSRQPLVLSRLTEVVCRSAAHDDGDDDDDDAGANTSSRPTGSRARDDNNTTSGGGHGLDVSLALPAAASSHHRHRHRARSSSSSRAAREHHGSAAVTSKTTRHGHMDANAALTQAPHASPLSVSPLQPSSATSSSLTALVPPPMPVIVPTHTHITSNTPVCVSAAHYYTTQAMHGLTEDGYRLDSLTCATLETVMCNSNNSSSSHAATARASEQRVHVSHGRLRDCAFVVQPHSGTVSLWVPGMATAVPVVRRAADVVRYAVDAAGPSQWSLFVRPFCLPPGRWCVRAKSSTFDDVHYTTSAKVYTVDVA